MRLHRRRRGRAQAGFTLIELMISLVMFSFAIAGILSVAVAMTSGFREQKQAIGAEGASRMVMEFLGDAIRGASPGVPSGQVENLDVAACTLGTITVTNSSTAPDELTLVFAYGSVVTSSRSLFTGASGSLDVVDATGFAADDMILVTNYGTGHLAKISSVVGNTLNFAGFACGAPTLPVNYLAGAVVIRAARARFYVADLDGIPTLWMDPDAEGTLPAEPMAEGIEDMQVEVGYDYNPVNSQLDQVGAVADDDDWIHNVAGETEPVAVPALTPRALKISLLARSTGAVTGVGSFSAPALGDRAPSANDNFRRRVLSSIIEIRNLKDSP